MISSIMELEQESDSVMKNEKLASDWYEKLFINEALYELDNRFIFDKYTWKDLLRTKIGLSHRGKVINCKKSIWKKIANESGINLDIQSMYKLNNYQRTSLLDTIDANRANDIFISLLLFFSMNQRIMNLKDWLLNNNFNIKQVKKVANIYFIGKFYHHIEQRNGLCLESHITIISLNSFIIWKHTTNWKIYAEISTLDKIVKFNNSRRKRKRRRNLYGIFIIN